MERGVAISVQSISKSYRLRHERHQRYRSLREEVMEGVRGVFKRGIRSPDRVAHSEEFHALRDVTFTVKEGDRLGIVGRNGAGKSTLLKVLSRITDPTVGRVEMTGRISSLLEVGTGFHPELTGRENIFLNGAILGMGVQEVRRKFDQIVDFAEVERFLDTPVKRYSSGMYVRLAFAVAAHLEPDVLIVDEVLAVGDVQFQHKCLGRMEELSKSGRTILFVTHNMDAMLTLCTRGILLEAGHLVFDGTPLEARNKYVTQAAGTRYSVEGNMARGGSGGVRIQEIWFNVRDQHDCDVATIETGSPLSICLRANVELAYQDRRDMEVAFGIDSLDGQRLYTVLSSWNLDEVRVNGSEIRVSCDLDSVPFVPGKYLISASMLFRGDTLDSIQHCAAFDVIPRARSIHIERLHGWGLLDMPCHFRNL